MNADAIIDRYAEFCEELRAERHAAQPTFLAPAVESQPELGPREKANAMIVAASMLGFSHEMLRSVVHVARRAEIETKQPGGNS